MADENGTGAESQQTNPPQQLPQNNPPQQTAPRTDPPQFINDLRASLDALPEKVANAIAEAMPKPSTPPPAQKVSQQSDSTSGDAPTGQGKTGSQKASQSAGEQTPPGRKNFVEWWTGAPAGSHR
jgi:hypothetical protein